MILIVILVVSCYYAWKNYEHRQRMDDGNVSCTGCLSPEQESAFKRENAGETADGQSEHKFDFRGTEQDRHNGENGRRFDDGGGQPVPDNDPNQRFRIPERDGGYADDRGHDRADDRGFDHANDHRFDDQQRRFDDPGRRSDRPDFGRDTLQPIPPNGAAFAGRGEYQWYREGNLTWRLNTETGASCVAYATLEEWRKPLVFTHGCGRG
ncbi:hypothetical protein [Granulicella tundricola]|uniref:hypothetical protein n=1 Tax=Granulicella tundricola TaxID=940615 RepID=UPI0018DCE5CA|nr:hypothetical protein [Granulicella tundricola]